VEDRYAGDPGDLLKLGLLRSLIPGGLGLRLGVVWYRTLDEQHNADGKHVAYLEVTHRSAAALRRLDADLYDRLQHVVQAGRSVAALERAGVLDGGCRFFSTRLAFANLPVGARRERTERRDAWLVGALEATVGCDVVFADPDNGIPRADHLVARHRTAASSMRMSTSWPSSPGAGSRWSSTTTPTDPPASMSRFAADSPTSRPAHRSSRSRRSRLLGHHEAFLIGAASANHARLL
jgi:hypothetical protein